MKCNSANCVSVLVCSGWPATGCQRFPVADSKVFILILRSLLSSLWVLMTSSCYSWRCCYLATPLNLWHGISKACECTQVLFVDSLQHCLFQYQEVSFTKNRTVEVELVTDCKVVVRTKTKKVKYHVRPVFCEICRRIIKRCDYRLPQVNCAIVTQPFYDRLTSKISHSWQIRFFFIFLLLEGVEWVKR